MSGNQMATYTRVSGTDGCVATGTPLVLTVPLPDNADAFGLNYGITYGAGTPTVGIVYREGNYKPVATSANTKTVLDPAGTSLTVPMGATGLPPDLRAAANIEWGVSKTAVTGGTAATSGTNYNVAMAFVKCQVVEFTLTPSTITTECHLGLSY